MIFGWRVTVEVPAAEAELVADRCFGFGALGLEEQGDDPVTLLVGFAEEADARAAAADIGGIVEAIEDDSWADAWREYAAASRVGDVLVQPAWLPLDADHGAAVVITLDPGRAFGSGAHASTRLALGALWREPLDGAFVLDVGTGSGVLAIAAAKRGAAQIIATDIDPVALVACAENAQRNDVGTRIAARPETLDEFATAFDAVAANMLAVTLRELAPELARVVVPGGVLVLSGMLDEQVASVCEVFVDAGCTVREVHHEDGWAAVVLDRNDADDTGVDPDIEWYADWPDDGDGLDDGPTWL